MSTLGKIVTVLMVIASLVVASMVVAMVKLPEDWHKVALSAEQALDESVKTVQIYMAAMADQNNEYRNMRRVYEERAAAMRQAADDLRGSISRLQDEKNRQETRLAELKANITNLDNSLKALVEDKKKLESQYDSAVTDATALRQRNAQLTAALQNVSSQAEDLKTRCRDLEVQVADLRKKLNWYVQNFTGEAPTPVPPVPTVDLAGVINNVSMERKVAEISLGSRDKVVEKMVFIVSRGDQYLGDLVIEKVDENSSVGRLETVQGEIRSGDHVTYTVKR